MYDEHIQMINDWFKQHDDYGTYHVDDEYAVRIGDMREFRDLIAEIPYSSLDLTNVQIRKGLPIGKPF